MAMESCSNRLDAEMLPDELAGLNRGRTTLRHPERPEAGFSVAYQRPGVKARVTRFDRGLDDIPDGPQSAVVFDEVNQVLADLSERVEIGMYDGVHIVDQYITDASLGAPQFSCVEYEYRRRGEQVLAAAYLTGHQGQIVKATLEQAPAHADATVPVDFLRHLCRVLNGMN